MKKIQKYTRNEWRRLDVSSLSAETLSVSAEVLAMVAPGGSQVGKHKVIQVKLHSKRVETMRIYTPNEWRRCETTLEASGEDAKLHSKRVGKM